MTSNPLFADLPVAVTLDGQIKELRRELMTREGVYPLWIKQGRITQTLADKRVAAMKAALATLEELKKTTGGK